MLDKNLFTKKIARKIKETRERVSLMLDEFKIHEAIISINELITFGDRYINENAIWKDTESKKEKMFNAVGYPQIAGFK